MGKYGNVNGQEGFKNALAKYMTKHWFDGIHVDPKNLLIQNGCGSALESLI